MDAVSSTLAMEKLASRGGCSGEISESLIWSAFATKGRYRADPRRAKRAVCKLSTASEPGRVTVEASTRAASARYGRPRAVHQRGFPHQ